MKTKRNTNGKHQCKNTRNILKANVKTKKNNQTFSKDIQFLYIENRQYNNVYKKETNKIETEYLYMGSFLDDSNYSLLLFDRPISYWNVLSMQNRYDFCQTNLTFTFCYFTTVLIFYETLFKIF